MSRYLVRRLLLIVPTLWGVTLVSFAIMQLAPGDPLSSRGDQQGGQRARSRDSYLVQRRELGLDRPPLVNLHGWRDYRPGLRAAAWCLGQTVEQLADQLPTLVNPLRGTVAASQKQFLMLVAPREWETLLAERAHHPLLAVRLVDQAGIWCESLGRYGVAPALALLADEQLTPGERCGLLRALNKMLVDPFVYTFSRTPRADESAQVMATWRRYLELRGQSGISSVAAAAIDDDSAQAELQSLVGLVNRSELMAGLEQVGRQRVDFYLSMVVADRTTLAERNVAALALRLHLGKPLRTDVSTTATAAEVAEVAGNWLAWWSAARGEFEPGLLGRLLGVVTDTQYARLVGRLVTFDFGRSALPTREPVAARIWRAARVTGPLMLASQALIYLLAIPLGIVAAIHRGRWLDRSISLGLFVLYSVPTFVAAMCLLLLFCYGTVWKVFPIAGLHSDLADNLALGPWLADYAWHATLPVICLSLFSLAGMAMYARASMLDCLGEDYLRTARAKGVPESRVVWQHALRNALLPLVTLFADFLPALLGGSVLVEVLFSIPGMGRLSWVSIEQKDYPTLMALVYVEALVVLASLLLSDLLYAVVDPRIQLDAPVGGA